MGGCLDVCICCPHPMTCMYHNHDYLYKQTDGAIDTIDLFLRFNTCFAQGNSSTQDQLSTHQSGPICDSKVYDVIPILICYVILIVVWIQD